jgi:hypothetical protein
MVKNSEVRYLIRMEDLRNVTVTHNIDRGAETVYRGADKSLARPTSRCILFDG